MVYAPVQTDKTIESVRELIKELNDYKTSRPATAAELRRAILGNTRSLPGAFETSDDVLDSLVSSARYGRPWNYPATLKEKYEALDRADISAAALEVVHPESLIWVIVGDLEKIEQGLRGLNLGPVEVRDLD
jgi:zinc protease